MGRPSVLFIGHTYLTAISQKKLLALRERGYRVGVLVPSNWRDRDALFAGKHLAPQKAAEDLPVFTAPVIRSGHIASHFYLPGAILRVIHTFNPDIVQVEQEIYSYVAAQAALTVKLNRRKLAIFGWENLDRPLHITQRLCRRLTLSLADAIVCGNYDGATLVRKWGYSGPLEVMPQLGVDPAQFFPHLRDQEETLRIGFVGRLVPEKGVDLLLRAFRPLLRKGHKAELLILGSGPQREAWQRLAGDLKIADGVQWVNSVPHDHVPEYMAQMDVLVLPSRSTSMWKEQFGLVLAQAMAMGIPVVGSNCGAIPEVIGRQDVIFPEGDAVALSHILERMLMDVAWRRELSEYGRERALHNYTNQALAERLDGLFRTFLDSLRRGAGSLTSMCESAQE